MRKILDEVVKNEDKYVKEENWVLDTVGSNLIDLLALDFIDYTKTTSTHIPEVYNVLGIEAARQTIYNEIVEVTISGVGGIGRAGWDRFNKT